MGLLEINEILRKLRSTRFSGRNYNIFTNNCNHFSEVLIRMLTN
jgi:hypothetical protein